MPKTTHNSLGSEGFLSAIAELDAEKRMCRNAVSELRSTLKTVLNSKGRELMGPYIVGDESGIEVPSASSTDIVRIRQAIFALTNRSSLRNVDLGNSMTKEELAVLYEAGCLDEDCGKYVTEETTLVDDDEIELPDELIRAAEEDELIEPEEISNLRIFSLVLEGQGQGADRIEWSSFEFKLDPKGSRAASAEIGRILHDFDYTNLGISEIATELLNRCPELSSINVGNTLPALCAIVGYCLGRIEPDAT